MLEFMTCVGSDLLCSGTSSGDVGCFDMSVIVFVVMVWFWVWSCSCVGVSSSLMRGRRGLGACAGPVGGFCRFRSVSWFRSVAMSVVIVFVLVIRLSYLRRHIGVLQMALRRVGLISVLILGCFLAVCRCATQPSKYVFVESGVTHTCYVLNRFENFDDTIGSSVELRKIVVRDPPAADTIQKISVDEMENLHVPSNRVIYGCCKGCDTIQERYRPAERRLVSREHPGFWEKAAFAFGMVDKPETKEEYDDIPSESTAVCVQALRGIASPPCVCSGPEAEADYALLQPGGCPIGKWWSGCTPQWPGSCVDCNNGIVGSFTWLTSGGFQSDSCTFECKGGGDPHYYTTDPVSGQRGCFPCEQCQQGYRVQEACLQTVSGDREYPTKCIACPDGWSTMTVGATSCVECPLGTAAVSGGECVACPSNTKTPSVGSAFCVPCDDGHMASSDFSTCVPCDPGWYRGRDDLACLPCPVGSAQPLAGQGSCETCVGSVADSEGLTACTGCAADQVASFLTYNADGTVETGSTECIPCSRRGVPSDELRITWLGDCRWECREGYYRDSDTGECFLCSSEACPADGLYRPFCQQGQRGLIPCEPCRNVPRAGAVAGVHFQYTGRAIGTAGDPTPGCSFECLPGTSGATCVECGAIDANAIFTDLACNWRCKDGWRWTGLVCEECALLDYPKTLQGYAANAFLASGEFIDFSVCNDGVSRRRGLVTTWSSGTHPPLCGNGVLETWNSEECDDGGVANGDGCSATCELEETYHDCSVVGRACVENCSFPWHGEGGVVGLYGYYLTDARCSGGPRDVSQRAVCGATCAGRESTADACTPANQGCLNCITGTYLDPTLRECMVCGSRCGIGYYDMGFCGAGLVPGTQPTAAQKGCGECSSGAGAVFTGVGNLGQPWSCPHTCGDGFWCSNGVDVAGGSVDCAVPCSVCTDPGTLSCAAGERAVECSLFSDARCEPCDPGLGPGEAWDPGLNAPCRKRCLDTAPERKDLGACVECVDPSELVCPRLYRAAVCPGDPSKQYCVPCSASLDVGAENVGVGEQCVLQCIDGKYFGTPGLATESGGCRECMSPLNCTAGELYVRCRGLYDAFCMSCSDVYPELDLAGDRLEYYSPVGELPLCQTRCVSGYARNTAADPPVCSSCANVCRNQPGFFPVHRCVGERERDEYPECLPCDSEASGFPGVDVARYTEFCKWECQPGFYRDVLRGVETCLPCDACGIGEYPQQPASCTKGDKSMTCVRCTEIPEHGVGTSTWDPSCPYVCAIGYFKVVVDNGRREECRSRWEGYGEIDVTPPPPPPGDAGNGGGADVLIVELPTDRPLRGGGVRRRGGLGLYQWFVVWGTGWCGGLLFYILFY